MFLIKTHFTAYMMKLKYLMKVCRIRWLIINIIIIHMPKYSPDSINTVQYFHLIIFFLDYYVLELSNCREIHNYLKRQRKLYTGEGESTWQPKTSQIIKLHSDKNSPHTILLKENKLWWTGPLKKGARLRGFAMKPRLRGSHSYSKSGCKHGGCCFPPAHSPCFYSNNVRGSRMFFSLLLFLPGKRNNALLRLLLQWGLRSLSHPDLYPGDSWQSLCSIKGSLSFYFFQEDNYTGSCYGGWLGVHWLMGTDGSQPALPAVQHLTCRAQKLDASATLICCPQTLTA